MSVGQWLEQCDESDGQPSKQVDANCGSPSQDEKEDEDGEGETSFVGPAAAEKKIETDKAKKIGKVSVGASGSSMAVDVTLQTPNHTPKSFKIALV